LGDDAKTDRTLGARFHKGASYGSREGEVRSKKEEVRV
jgi:hypothetical protein